MWIGERKLIDELSAERLESEYYSRIEAFTSAQWKLRWQLLQQKHYNLNLCFQLDHIPELNIANEDLFIWLDQHEITYSIENMNQAELQS